MTKRKSIRFTIDDINPDHIRDLFSGMDQPAPVGTAEQYAEALRRGCTGVFTLIHPDGREETTRYDPQTIRCVP